MPQSSVLVLVFKCFVELQDLEALRQWAGLAASCTTVLLCTAPSRTVCYLSSSAYDFPRIICVETIYLTLARLLSHLHPLKHQVHRESRSYIDVKSYTTWNRTELFLLVHPHNEANKPQQCPPPTAPQPWRKSPSASSTTPCTTSCTTW